MAGEFSELSHFKSDGTRPVAVLSLRTLKSLSNRDIDILSQLEITTLSELLHFQPIHRARTVMAAFLGQLGHDVDLAEYLDNPPRSLDGIDVDDPAKILGIGLARAAILKDGFGVATIRALADFPPMLEAEQLVAEQATAFSEAASAPDELIPRYRGAAPVTRTRYSSFVREGTANLNHRIVLSEDHPPHLDRSLARLFIRFDEDGDQPKGGSPFNPDLGFALLHEQTWRPIGLRLGEPLHSLGLSPGEVRKVAIIDWRQSLRAARGEDTSNTETLNSFAIHQRALDEVVRTTAEEHQSGRTNSIAATGLGAGAGVASGAMVGAIGGAMVGGATLGIAGLSLGGLAGLLAGGAGGGAAAAPTAEVAAPAMIPAGAAIGAPLGAGLGGLGGTLTGATLGALAGSAVGGAAAALGGALLGSASGAIGHIESSSEGDREVFGRLNQNIMDVASQKASHVRSLRSSVVVDATQSENETLTTYVVANNNRAHALTLVYFELLNKYQVDIRTTRVDPLIFIPFSPLHFDFELLARYWHVLRLGIPDANLIESVDELLASTEYFKGSLDGSISQQDPARLSQIKIKLKLPPSLTDSSSFHVFLQANNGQTEIPYLEIASVTASGITFAFQHNNLDVDLASITGIRVTGGASLSGGRAIVRVPRMRIRSLGANRTFRDLSVGGFDFEPGLGIDRTLAFNPISQVQAVEQAQNDDYLVFERVLDILNRRAYYFTRFVLIGLDPAEVEDLIESLTIRAVNGLEVSLSALISLQPVGFAGGSIVFRLKRDPQLNAILTGEVESIFDTGVGPFQPALPNLPDLLDFDAIDVFSENLNRLRKMFKMTTGKFLEFIDRIKEMEKRERAGAAQSREIALPTSGLFAEAILGRSISAELIDARRYIAWDFPNPNQPPNIADVTAGDRGQPLPSLNATVEEGTLTINNPTTLPDPSGFAGAFPVLSNGNLFRDMSKSEQLTQTLGKLADVALASATKAGDLAGEAQKAALDAANQLATEVAKSVGRVADFTNSLTELGAKLNAGVPVAPMPTPKTNPFPTPTPVPNPAPTPVPPRPRPVGTTPQDDPVNAVSLAFAVRSIVSVEGGPSRGLNGTYFIALADKFRQIDQTVGPASDEIEIKIAAGVGQIAEVLTPGTYTVAAQYVPSRALDLILLKQPQVESLGLNGRRLTEAVLGLLQEDLTTRLEIDANIFNITPTTSLVRLDINAAIVESDHAEIEVEFDLGAHYELDGESKVVFDLNAAAPLIVAAISAAFTPVAGLAAAIAMKVFSVKSTIEAADGIKASANGKVKFSFKPCFLQNFEIVPTVT